jgi:hypothetical protein
MESKDLLHVIIFDQISIKIINNSSILRHFYSKK